ncbi:hypothetical protein ACH5RR_012259 [Cinchona calisaya]|uniref:Reverse transcriptase n=1 Tax=Cinchona calisaya TaxID=153742 RepID=A0ABD3A8U6_9GENT
MLCSKGLSNLIKKYVESKLIRGLKISKTCPTFTHIFFSDDTFLFCKANKHEAEVIRRILGNYEKASDQKINLDKSAFFFTKNTSDEVVKAVGQIRQFDSSSAKQIFGVANGKEVLLKSVVMALPSYAMSVFKLSKRLCKDVCRMMAKF